MRVGLDYRTRAKPSKDYDVGDVGVWSSCLQRVDMAEKLMRPLVAQVGRSRE